MNDQLGSPQSTAPAEGDAPHAALCLLAERWLRRQGFGVVFRDRFRAITDHGEQPDAIGWRGGISAVIECKATRADFLADRNKPFRVEPTRGMGDWRFYLSPGGVITVADLPSGWGLLHANGSRVSSVHGVPGNVGWRTGAPFAGAKTCEVQMLYSALRRMVLRGHFDAVYDPIPTGLLP